VARKPVPAKPGDYSASELYDAIIGDRMKLLSIFRLLNGGNGPVSPPCCQTRSPPR